VKRIVIFILIFLKGTLLSQGASQEQSAKITVAVVDGAGAAFSQAHLLLVDLNTFETRKQDLGMDAKFRFNELKPGRYAIIGADRQNASCLLPVLKQVLLGPSQTANLRLVLLLDKKNRNCLEPIQ
jgi:hypothetical protein